MFESRLFPALYSAVLSIGLVGCQDVSSPPPPLPPPPPPQGAVGGELSGNYESVPPVVAPGPVSVEDVFRSNTADLNGDGYVTLNEVVAMERAGLSDDQMLARLRATGQMYQLTPSQEQYLRSNLVSNFVIRQMETLNRSEGGAYPQSYQQGGTANPPADSVISLPPLEPPPGPLGIPTPP